MNPVPNLIERIRKHPGIYLDQGMISALYHTIIGYELALHDYGMMNVTTEVLPQDFHGWVAYRLHYSNTVRGWKNMILESCQQDEEAAFSRFFELLDEYSKREGKVVARVTGIRKSFSQNFKGQTIADRYPSSIFLVSYTNDPGFFVVSNEPGYRMPFVDHGFSPTIRTIELDTGIDRSQWEVFIPEIFKRWIREEGSA